MSLNEESCWHTSNVTNLSKVIVDKEDQKTGIYALKHVMTGKFLTAYISATADRHYVLSTDGYTARTDEKGNHFSGLWYLDENLLDEHKPQLLVASFSPKNDELDYSCASYNFYGNSVGVDDCVFDRPDVLFQRFIIDRDQTNSSVVTIIGRTRTECFGLSEGDTKALSCDLPEAKWLLYTE
ncbi:MAG: hypothetical protein DHS80DRAFT_32604 [Piptocephalis tieghemiana]|nr:MAG: hypothetical protein DHS80DRAFT_32604 [Piptocephalis tieghemiana]